MYMYLKHPYTIYVLQVYSVKCYRMHGARSGCVEVEVQCEMCGYVHILYIFIYVYIHLQ